MYVLTHSFSKLPVAMPGGAIAAPIPATFPCLRPLPLAMVEPPSLLEFSGLSESSGGAAGRFHGPATPGLEDPFVSCCCCCWDICG